MVPYNRKFTSLVLGQNQPAVEMRGCVIEEEIEEDIRSIKAADRLLGHLAHSDLLIRREDV